MGHLYHGELLVITRGYIPLSSHYSPLLTIKSPFSYGKPEAMLVITRGYMKPIITTTFEAHPRFTILSMDWFVGENLHRKPWFLPSNWSGFPVKIFPSSNSMILSWHHLSDFGRKKSVQVLRSTKKYNGNRWWGRWVRAFFPRREKLHITGLPQWSSRDLSQDFDWFNFWEICQLEQIKRANRAAQIKPLGWRLSGLQLGRLPGAS